MKHVIEPSIIILIVFMLSIMLYCVIRLSYIFLSDLIQNQNDVSLSWVSLCTVPLCWVSLQYLGIVQSVIMHGFINPSVILQRAGLSVIMLALVFWLSLCWVSWRPKTISFFAICWINSNLLAKKKERGERILVRFFWPSIEAAAMKLFEQNFQNW
jgi:hypothetical protein